MMTKTIYQVYLLLVCLFSIIVMTFNFGSMVFDAVTLAVPQYARRSVLTKFDSDAAYLQSLDKSEKESHVKMTPEKLEEQREQAKTIELNSIVGNAIADLLNSFVWLLVASILFGIHWGLFQKEKAQAS